MRKIVVLLVCVAISLGNIAAFADYMDKDSVDRFNEALNMAQKGDLEAMTRVGTCYEHGLEVKQNYAEAIKWLRKAADKNHDSAQCILGMIYENGNSAVKQNYSEAIKWYRKAAEKDNDIAQEHLGAMYYFAKGVRQSKSEAFLGGVKLLRTVL